MQAIRRHSCNTKQEEIMSTGKWSSTSPIDSYSTSKKVAVMLLDKFLLDSISAVHSAENVEKAPRRILPNQRLQWWIAWLLKSTSSLLRTQTRCRAFPVWSKHIKRFKITLFSRTKHNMRIVRVIPVIKLQIDTWTAIKRWKTMKNEMESIFTVYLLSVVL